MEFLDNVKKWPEATRSYVNELQTEMKRVTWPNSKQVRATTGVVILTVFAFAAYFAVVDLLLTRSVTKVYQIFTK